eukprot:TRINITY_DN712_c1_g1_i1.p1 TRINITY_DN712_c1_g1~~TRINITY_DN712_c1_g1_i1.p1  ORF type:complete len:262 (+),score=53.04 TRINITY_DN712_c1_g1_i1:49-834(+)
MFSKPKQIIKIDTYDKSAKMKLKNMLDETSHSRAAVSGMKITAQERVDNIKVETKGRVRDKPALVYVCTKYGAWKASEITWSRGVSFSSSTSVRRENLPPCLIQVGRDDDIWVEIRTKGSEKLTIDYLKITFTWYERCYDSDDDDLEEDFERASNKNKEKKEEETNKEETEEQDESNNEGCEAGDDDNHSVRSRSLSVGSAGSGFGLPSLPSLPSLPDIDVSAAADTVGNAVSALGSHLISGVKNVGKSIKDIELDFDFSD